MTHHEVIDAWTALRCSCGHQVRASSEIEAEHQMAEHVTYHRQREEEEAER